MRKHTIETLFILLFALAASGSAIADDIPEIQDVELGFDGQAVHVSPDGKRAVVYGADELARSTHGESKHLAVIDLENGTVMKQKKIPQGIVTAHIEDDVLFIVPNSGELFYRTSHQLENQERKFVGARPQRILKVSPKTLAVISKQTEYFDLETLQSKTSLPSRFNVAFPSVLDSRHVLDNGRVIDVTTGKTVRIMGPTVLPGLLHVNTFNHRRRQSFKGDLAMKWGRQLHGHRLLGGSNRRIAEFKNREGIISGQSPVALMFGSEKGRVTKLFFHDLVDGAEKKSVNIGVERFSFRTNAEKSRMVHRRDKIVLLYGGNLLIVSFPKSEQSKFGMPTHFAWKQPMEIPWGNVEKLALAVEGNAEGASFSLVHEHEGIEIDAETGEISIDTQKIWTAYADRTFRGRPAIPNVPRDVKLTNEELKSLLLPENLRVEYNSAEYKRITGRDLPPEKLATVIPVSVLLTDASDNEQSIRFALVVHVPRAQLDADIERHAKQRVIANDQRQKERQAAASPRRPTGRITSEEHRMNDRFKALETRLRRMEAVLDATLERLEKVEKSNDSKVTEDGKSN